MEEKYEIQVKHTFIHFGAPQDQSFDQHVFVLRPANTTVIDGFHGSPIRRHNGINI